MIKFLKSSLYNTRIVIALVFLFIALFPYGIVALIAPYDWLKGVLRAWLTSQVAEDMREHGCEGGDCNHCGEDA